MRCARKASTASSGPSNAGGYGYDSVDSLAAVPYLCIGGISLHLPAVNHPNWFQQKRRPSVASTSALPRLGVGVKAGPQGRPDGPRSEAERS